MIPVTFDMAVVISARILSLPFFFQVRGYLPSRRTSASVCVCSFCSHNKPPPSASLCLLPRPPLGSNFDADSDWTRWTLYEESYFVHQRLNSLVSDTDGDAAFTLASSVTRDSQQSPEPANDLCDG